MRDHALTRLDEIEGINSDPSTGYQLEAFEVMTSFAEGSEELRTLIERYGGSISPIMVQSLAATVALRARDPLRRRQKSS